LIDAGTMGLNGDGRVVAFGDFNGDQQWVFMPMYQQTIVIYPQRLDALVLASDQQTLSVYGWQRGKGSMFAQKIS
jgi:integrin alpha FG-GAP repeat containing protein 1